MKKLFSLAVLGAFALAGAAQNSVVYQADALLEPVSYTHLTLPTIYSV